MIAVCRRLVDLGGFDGFDGVDGMIGMRER